MSAKGEDLWAFKRLCSYLLELAECDLNYDVRDRSRFLKKLLSGSLSSHGMAEDVNPLTTNKDLYGLVEHLFIRKPKLTSAAPLTERFYLPGSLSQIVLHAAPGYEPLPKPCSVIYEDRSQLSDAVRGTTIIGDESSYGESNGSSDSDESRSLDEESASNYDPQQSVTGSIDSGGSDDSASEGDPVPLIQISEVAVAGNNLNKASNSSSEDVGELMSNRALESWLDEQPVSSKLITSEQSQVHGSSARISIGNVGPKVKAKTYTLLDPANGNGLKVYYSFSSRVSSISPLLVCLDVLFENCTSETMLKVTLEDEESSKALDSAKQTSVMAER